jgi:hypothetical protein
MVDIFGWMGGAASAVGSYLTQPASSPGQTTDEYAMPATPVSVAPSEVSAPVQPVIPENVSVVTGSRDESGEYRPISTDTSQPSTQSFVERYVAPTQEITRSDYVSISDLGDTKTQAMMKDKGYSVEQALSTQLDEARASGKSGAARYYQNELDKALESKIGLSSEYHAAAQESGLPQAPNPFEYVGDLSKQLLYKSAGVSNVPGTGLQPQYQGSMMKDVNILTKAARTGEMGDYGKLGKPYSSAYGILSLETQQDIGRTAAATARAKGIGWDVDEHAMDRFTPELKKSAGFDMFYTPAPEGDSTTTFGLVPFGKSEATKSGDKMVNIELESGDVIQRKASDYEVGSQFGILGSFVNKEATPRPTITGEIKSPGITKETINQYLLPEDMVDIGGKASMKVEVPGTRESKRVSENISNITLDIVGGSKKVGNQPTAEEIASIGPYRSPVDIALGTSGETIGGYTMETVGLNQPPPSGAGTKSQLWQIQLNKGSGGRMNILGINQRKAKPSRSKLQRKIKVKKPDPKILDLESLEKQIIPNSLGVGLFKFNIGTPDVLAKSLGVNAQARAKSNIKNMSKTLKIPDIKMRGIKKKSDVSGNINTILNGISRSVKSNKK